MHRTKSTVCSLVATLGTLLSASTFAADFKASGYDTPAYVDLEFSESRVNEPAGTVSINFIRTGDFRQTTTIDYQTEDGTATAGQDFKATGGTLTFKPGEGYKTLTVEILSDDQAESTESFRFTITGSSPNTMVMRTSAEIVIVDAPVPISPPVLQIAAATTGNIRLSWEGSDRCALERTTNPASGNWEPVTCSPTVNEDRCEVLQPVGGKFFFYRLRTP